jgi:hypothetical protein
VTHEWGFSVLVAAAARVGGLGPLVALRGALALTVFALVALAARRRAAEAAADPAFFPRPLPIPGLPAG